MPIESKRPEPYRPERVPLHGQTAQLAPLAIGSRIAQRFEVRQVCRGGLGWVFIVFDHADKVPRALKTFLWEAYPQLGQRRLLQERFAREAKHWIDLGSHPNIVRARWVMELEGRLFLALEYVPPAPGTGPRTIALADYLGGEPLPLDLLLPWALGICYGLQHAHSHGIACHRDLKPTNVLITHDNGVKVSDFGLAMPAASISSDGEISHPLARKVTGTVGYLAPEQYRGETFGARTDIHALGLMLHQLSTGSLHPPFVDPDIVLDPDRIYDRQMNESPPRVQGPLSPVVATCLSRDPSDRFADCSALIDALSTLYRRVLGTSPTPPDQRDSQTWEKVNRAASLLAMGEPTLAIEACNEVLSLDPGSAPALNNRGTAHAARGNHSEARADYDAALILVRDDPRVHCNRAFSWLEDGYYELALGDYTRALDLDPRFAAAYSGRARARSQMADLVGALEDCDAAVRAAPRDATNYFERANLLEKLGRADDAIADHDRALARDPLLAAAYCNRGLLHLDQGRLKEALRDLGTATRLRPLDPACWMRLGRALIAGGNLAGARRCYDRALNLDRSDAECWSDRGNLRAATGDCPGALTDYAESLARDPTCGNVWMRKGAMEDALGLHAAAIGSYRRLLALCTEDMPERDWAIQRLLLLEDEPQAAEENSEKTE